jgi:glycosyltransferase involved in cell wall biosynthesis
MKASICVSTYDRPEILRRVLGSIFSQKPPFEYEVIVVDDAGPSSSEEVCKQYPVIYKRIEREPGYRNPAIARNVAYKTAQGEVLICQSDDVIHGSGKVIQHLVEELKAGEFLLATVWNVDVDGQVTGLKQWPHIRQIVGPKNQRPLFFLGAVYRKDMCAIGGCDEDFIDPGREDVWLAQCLIHGRGLRPRYSAVEGFHNDHERPAHLLDYYARSMALYERKLASAQAGLTHFHGGDPWPYSPPTAPLAPGTP